MGRLCLQESEYNMTIKNGNLITKESKTLFSEGIDYTKKSLERPYVLLLETGTKLYLNLEQYKFMMESKWEEKRKRYIQTRCLVLAERGGCKKCQEDCSYCLWFMTKKVNGGQVSLDYLYEENELELPDYSTSVLEEMIKEEILKSVKEEFDKVENEMDKRLIYLLLEGKTEREIAAELNIPKSTVHDKKTKFFKIVKQKVIN